MFEFATAGRIVFGAGALRQAGCLAAELGKCALVVTGSNTRRAEPLLDLLKPAAVKAVCFATNGEPELETVEAAVATARQSGCDMVISIGGGSVIDTGKAAAAMLANGGELLDYLEVIGRGKALTRPSLPFMAIPTTAGTGSEVTRNAVLGSPAHGVKVSLRSAFMLPRVALVDPELTYGLPPAITAASGLDALTQLIEPYVCSRRNPLTDGVCLEGLRRATRSLRRAYAEPQCATVREEMSVASLCGGLALANAGLGAVHGFAGPIGGMFPAPHGAVCAALLPQVVRANVAALKQREPDGEPLRRYVEIARLALGQASAKAEDLAAWLGQLVKDLGIPRLGTYGVGHQHTTDLVEKALKASSMKANPIPLEREELAQTLEAAL